MDDKKPTREDEWLTTAEVAALIKRTPDAVYRMRKSGNGPAYVKPMPGMVRYRRADVESWLMAGAVTR